MRHRGLIAAIAAFALWPTAELPAQEGRAAPLYDCVIKPKSIVELGTPEEGILTSIAVQRGDVVKVGQPVAELDSELQKLQVELMTIRANSSAELDSNRVKLDYREKQSERMHKLFQRRVISATQREEAEVEETLAAYNLSAAKINRDIYRTELKQAKERLARRTLRSPVDGIVTEVMMSEGEYVHEQVSVMRIAELHPLHVEVFLPVSEYHAIIRGRTATVFPQAPIGGRYAADIEVVDKVFDAASETFGVRLLLDNRDYRLPGGLRCKISFNTGT